MPFELMDVKKEYDKDKNLKREDIKILAEWLEKQPHLPKATELQLILFLHSCYYRLEVAKTTIDNFFTIRTLCPDLFGTPSIEVLKRVSNVGSINVLPKKTPEGYAVILIKLIDTNPEHYNNISQINLCALNIILHLHQQGTCNGILVVLDTKGFVFGHLTKTNLTAVKKYMFYVQECAPLRLKGVHYINVSPITEKFIAMLKPFMKKKLLDMINFHSDSMESLYKFVPKEILPQDYGGEAPPLMTLHEQNRNNLFENIDFFKWMDTLKVDENKRPGKPKNVGDICCVGDTFKKFEVD